MNASARIVSLSLVLSAVLLPACEDPCSVSRYIADDAEIAPQVGYSAAEVEAYVNGERTFESRDNESREELTGRVELTLDDADWHANHDSSCGGPTLFLTADVHLELGELDVRAKMEGSASAADEASFSMFTTYADLDSGETLEGLHINDSEVWLSLTLRQDEVIVELRDLDTETVLYD